MFSDPDLARFLAAHLQSSVDRELGPGEQVLGMFRVTRLRRGVEALVVTNRRLLTFGPEHLAHPLVDDVALTPDLRVAVDRESVLRRGEVRAHDADGGERHLGTLSTRDRETVLDTMEEVLDLARRTGEGVGAGLAPVLPLPGSGPGGPEVVPSASRSGQSRHMHLDPTLPARRLPSIRRAAQAHCQSGERVLGIFSVSRWRVPISALVVTTERFFTLGNPVDQYPVVDEAWHDDVDDLSVARETSLRGGTIRATTTWGDVALGTFNSPQNPEVWRLWDLVTSELESARSQPAVGTPAVAGGRIDPAVDGVSGGATGGATDGAGGGGPAVYLPLVEQLGELGRLHQQGLLTEEEFAAAKAKLLS